MTKEDYEYITKTPFRLKTCYLVFLSVAMIYTCNPLVDTLFAII